MKKDSTWKFIFKNPIIAFILFLIWSACLLTMAVFILTSGETDVVWISVFCSIPAGTMYCSWLIIQLVYSSEIHTNDE